MALVGSLRRFDHRDNRALEQGRRPADHRMMRSGKAEDAVAATLMDRRSSRQAGRIGIVMAQFERRRGGIGLRQRRESAKDDQQALRGNRISDGDPDQRSPETPGILA
jgi:hypothetical protein